ncbi:MAG: hypothetical protein K2N14_03530 [Clostridia bacterium]|nr:hypothetical protein [Clostridia bacterium]
MNRNKLSTAITVIAAVLAAGLAAWGGYVFCTQIKIDGATELYALIPVYLILVVLGAFLEQIVHEGAHFLVGSILSMGLKLPKLRLFKSSSVDVYPKGAKCIKLRFVLTAAAGLFFDLLLIVLGIFAFAIPSVPAIFGIAFPYAFYSFVINVVPFEYKSGKTDGLVIKEVLSKDDSAQVMLAVLKVQGLVNGGMLLKDIDENMLLDLPQIAEDDINFIILTQLRYEYYLAKGDDSTAYKYFLRYKDLIQYLPSEYGADATARRKVEAEIEMQMEEDETVDLEDIKKAAKKGKKARPKKQTAEAEQTAEEQSTEQTAEAQNA